MRFFSNLALMFYVSIITLFSGFVLLFVSHTVMLQEVNYYLGIAYYDTRIRVIVGGIGFFLIFLSFIFARIISGSKHKEKTIAFDNPIGRVSISLVAVEDSIRRLLYRIPEIKEVRPFIIASKKGIEVEVRLVFKADVNIPEATSRLQEMVKNKIQEILGLEETVIVRLHVVKIISEQPKAKRQKTDEETGANPTVPFQGYRY